MRKIKVRRCTGWFQLWAVAVRIVPAIAAAADEEGAAGGSPQPLAHMVDLRQNFIILRGRHRSISRRPLRGPIKLSDLRAQATRFVQLDAVRLHGASDTGIHALYLVDQSCLMRAGVGAGKRNGDEKCGERCSPEVLGVEERMLRLLLQGGGDWEGHLPAVGRRFRRVAMDASNAGGSRPRDTARSDPRQNVIKKR
ncbi:hypothetical protein [Mesorhizobium sp.]|uniref:hypothetical protein n=1 Tax=Mesorhizobium sp. TaxID=1871066 RepID=UPI00257D6582|nr:hypothetical protein [Mesorhizobium sp.]